MSDDNLSDSFHLAISRKGSWGLSARITRGLPNLDRGEVALALNLTLPKALFLKPSLKASITVPGDKVSAPVIDAIVLDNIKQVMSQQFGVNVELSVVEPTTVTV